MACEFLQHLWTLARRREGSSLSSFHIFFFHTLQVQESINSKSLCLCVEFFSVTNEKSRFEIELRRHSNTHLFCSVDKFIVFKSDPVLLATVHNGFNMTLNTLCETFITFFVFTISIHFVFILI
jgi:hypothetical protein